MITKLAAWYEIVNLNNLSTDILTKRLTDVTKIAKAKKLDWMLNCVRLFINKPIQGPEFSLELTGIFLEGDPLFPQRKNELELRVLAGAILYEYIINLKSKDRIYVALAMKCGLFQINSNLINTDIIESVIAFIDQSAVALREFVKKPVPTLSLETTSDGTPANIILKLTAINDQFKLLNNSLSESTKRLDVLEEESNIHWWIFRGFSNDFKKSFSELESHNFAMAAGRELSSLTNIIPPPISSEEFLKKIIKDADQGDTETSIRDCVNELNKDYKEDLVNNKLTAFGNLCPIALAINKSLEIEGKTGWVAPFEKQAAIKAQKKVGNDELATQFFYENILAKGNS